MNLGAVLVALLGVAILAIAVRQHTLTREVGELLSKRQMLLEKSESSAAEEADAQQASLVARKALSQLGRIDEYRNAPPWLATIASSAVAAVPEVLLFGVRVQGQHDAPATLKILLDLECGGDDPDLAARGYFVTLKREFTESLGTSLAAVNLTDLEMVPPNRDPMLEPTGQLSRASRAKFRIEILLASHRASQPDVSR